VQTQLSIVQTSPTTFTLTSNMTACTLVWSVDNSAARLSTQLTCSAGVDMVQATYAGGTLTLNGAGMLTGSATGMLGGDYMHAPATGNATLLLDCERL
jgi:hypothetical protein